MPDWQAGNGVHGPYSDAANCGLASGYCRQSPDISLVADPATGYPIFCSSQISCAGQGWMAIGGTSAAAPLMAAITADMNEYSQAHGGQRLGFANPFFYQTFATTPSAFHDITDGSNDVTGGYLGLYPATDGYDMASGLGSIDADALAQSLVGYSQNPTYPEGIWDTSDVTVQTPDPWDGARVGGLALFSGYLTEHSTGLPIANRPLTINLESATGSQRWLYARTDHLGHWSVYARFSERMDWVVRFLGDEHYTASHSAVGTFHVFPTLTIGSSRSVVPRNVKMFITGHTAPAAMKGLKLRLQQFYSGAWHNLWLVPISKTGGVKTSIFFRGAGLTKLRWFYGGGPRWLAAASPAKTIRST